MKRLYYALLVSSVFMISINCQKEISYNGPEIPGPGNNPAAVVATIQGNVVDENGAPALGVMLKVGNENISTDSKGYFRVSGATLDKNQSLVTAEKPGYFKAYRTFIATTGANYIKIKLVKKELAGTVDATAGGSINLHNGAKVELPGRGIVNSIGGATYSGEVKVYASYIDPSSADIAQVVPGSFMADDKDNKRVILESYGMLAVELESPAGEKLQLAPGSGATLTCPIPASLRNSAPATIPLWYVDEQSGVWKEEGKAIKQGNNYVGIVNHFSFWNCDLGVPMIRLSATLKESKGFPIVHGLVRTTRLSAGFASQAYSWTDSLGQISGLVPANESLVFELLDQCNNVVFTKSIAPNAKDTDLGTITVPGTNSSVVTIEGVLKTCNNLPVIKGFVLVYHDNISRLIAVNGKGEFSLSFVRCITGASNLEITGVDEVAQEQGTTVAISITAPNTNAGTVIACGTSTSQYINYTIDGASYSLSSSTNDSLWSTTYLTQTTSATWLSGSSTTSNNSISLYFEHAASAGTYSVADFSVSRFDSAGIVQPFNIVITNYAAGPGGFHEGSFSGKFQEIGKPVPIHNVNGTFRVRRF